MRRHIHIVCYSMLFICLLSSCSAEEEGVVQPYSAGSNAAITDHAVLGAKESKTYIRKIAFSNAGSIFFFGLVNGLWSIGRIEIDGDIPWQKDPRFFVKELCAFDASIGAGGYAIAAIGNSTKSTDSERTYGIIDVYDRDGAAIIVRARIEDPEYDIRLDGLQLVSDTPDEPVFFIAGGAGKDGVFYPFCALFSISSDSTISIISRKVLSDCPNEYFIGATWNMNESSPLYFVSSMSSFSECPYWYASETASCYNDLIVCIDNALGIVWRKAITPSDATLSDIHAIEYSDGALYATGGARVTKADGRQWSSGFVASVAESGDINWSKSITLSEHADRYYDLEVNRGILYAIGEYTFFVQSASNRCYGYALISRFKLPSGELESHSTFGGNRSSSGLRTVEINGNSAICGGWTNLILDESWVQGWLIDIDILSLAGGSSVPPVVDDALRGNTPASMYPKQ